MVPAIKVVTAVACRWVVVVLAWVVVVLAWEAVDLAWAAVADLVPLAAVGSRAEVLEVALEEEGKAVLTDLRRAEISGQQE